MAGPAPLIEEVGRGQQRARPAIVERQHPAGRHARWLAELGRSQRCAHDASRDRVEVTAEHFAVELVEIRAGSLETAGTGVLVVENVVVEQDIWHQVRLLRRARARRRR